MPKKEVWDTYPEIYHYTSFSSALLIIHSATLRANQFDSLNDTQELLYAKNIISQKLLEKFPGDTPENRKYFVDKFYSIANAYDFYITSFCGKNPDLNSYHRENGLLSMWRNYGNDGGCALIFKTKNMYARTQKYYKRTQSIRTIIMGDAIYEKHNDNQPGFQENLNRFIENASNYQKNPQDESAYNMDDLYINLMELIVCTKHPSFHEELEVRIALCSRDTEETKNLTPKKQYHPIPFAPDKDISRIIIGPHRNQQERYDFLKSYLSKFRLKNIDVTKSEIPLRT